MRRLWVQENRGKMVCFEFQERSGRGLNERRALVSNHRKK